MQNPIVPLSEDETGAVSGGLDIYWAVHALFDLVINDHCETDPT